MIIDNNLAIIKYSREGVEFQYLKLFIQTVREYIIAYKNVEYDKLTDKDKSIALARIIKAMEVNGQPVTVFFKEVLKQWEDKDNFEKNKLFIEYMAKEIFACYDKNISKNGDFYKSRYLFTIIKKNKREYFEPARLSSMEVKMRMLRGKSLEENGIYEYYLLLRRQEKYGTLPKVKIIV